MNKNTGIIIGGIALVVIVGGVYASMSTNDSIVVQDKLAEEKIMIEKKTMEEKDEMMKKEEANMMDKDMEKSDVLMKGSYEVYSSEKLALAETGKVVLFFKASWCPSCRAVDADIKASLNDIPKGVTILEVDYDKSKDLQQKYGVTSQHTFVQVDVQGNELAQWSGSPTLESVIEKIK